MPSQLGQGHSEQNRSGAVASHVEGLPRLLDIQLALQFQRQLPCSLTASHQVSVLVALGLRAFPGAMRICSARRQGSSGTLAFKQQISMTTKDSSHWINSSASLAFSRTTLSCILLSPSSVLSPKVIVGDLTIKACKLVLYPKLFYSAPSFICDSRDHLSNNLPNPRSLPLESKLRQRAMKKKKERKKKNVLRVPWWPSSQWIQRCHCCGTSSVPGLGNFCMPWVRPKEKCCYQNLLLMTCNSF